MEGPDRYRAGTGSAKVGDVDFTMDFSPDLPAMWAAIGLAALFFSASVALMVYRRHRGRSAGLGVYLLLCCTALAAYAAYRAYFPSCPRNWWC